MNNEEKYNKLYYDLAISPNEDIGDTNIFFDNEFIDYLVNRDEYGIGQLRIALERVDFSNYNLSDPISSSHKKLITFLLNFGINIKPIINNLNGNQYNELANYLKELCDNGVLKNSLILPTNDISIINSIDMVLDYNSLEYALTADSIDNDVKKYLFTYQENKELFINEFNVWTFYRITDDLKLDELFKEERRTRLIDCLLNPNLNLEDFREIICELICKDSYYNFMLNLEMFYNYSSSEKDISSELSINISYLMLIKDLMFEDNIEKIDINYFATKIDVIGEIYNKTINMIKENFNKKLNESLNDENIYLVHSVSIARFEENKDIKQVYNNNICNNKKRVSFSLLNDERTNVYFGNNSIKFGYNKTPEHLLIASLGDARTAQTRIWTRGSYLSIDDYLKNTTSGHNELLYGDINEVIEPDYLLSYNEDPTDLEVEIAVAFNIPIRYLKYNNLGKNNIFPDKEYKFHYNYITYIKNNINNELVR